MAPIDRGGGPRGCGVRRACDVHHAGFMGSQPLFSAKIPADNMTPMIAKGARSRSDLFTTAMLHREKPDGHWSLVAEWSGSATAG
jgi:hypothetical protein